MKVERLDKVGVTMALGDVRYGHVFRVPQTGQVLILTRSTAQEFREQLRNASADMMIALDPDGKLLFFSKQSEVLALDSILQVEGGGR